MYAEYEAAAGCDPIVDPLRNTDMVAAVPFNIFLRDKQAESSSKQLLLSSLLFDAAMPVWKRVLDGKDAAGWAWKPLTNTNADRRAIELKSVLDEIIMVGYSKNYCWLGRSL